MIVVDDLLDSWMVALHGSADKDNLLLRFATLAFAGTLPVALSSGLEKYPEGNTAVEIKISSRSPEDTPEDFEPDGGNLLENMLHEFPQEHSVKIFIPKKFIFTNHMSGISILPTLAGVYYNAEMITYMPDGKSFVIELYSKTLKRFVTSRVFED